MLGAWVLTLTFTHNMSLSQPLHFAARLKHCKSTVSLKSWTFKCNVSLLISVCFCGQSSPRLCSILCNSMDSSLPGSSPHGIFQARILEGAAIPSSRGSSQPRDRTHISYIAGGFFTTDLQGKSINKCCGSAAQVCPALCDPTDCSTSGFPVLHYLPEFAQTCVHWVSDGIQTSHPS